MSARQWPAERERDNCVVARRLTGTWGIVDMQLCDADALDLLGPAFIEFNTDDHGEFQFIAVRGSMDVRFESRRAGHGPNSLGTASSLVGRVFFHMGDDANLRAKAWTTESNDCRPASYRTHRITARRLSLMTQNGASFGTPGSGLLGRPCPRERHPDPALEDGVAGRAL